MKAYNFMKSNKAIKTSFLLGILFLFSCQSDYSKLVRKELASNVKNDTLFNNLRFGNTKKEFYQICWDLNKKGIVTHGENNNYVKKYLVPKDSADNLKTIKMLFYARFDTDDRIVAMDFKFSYSAWAPWNKDLLADALLPVVKDTLLKWYANPFMKMENGISVKVDGNRQIQIKKESDRDVSVLIENLEYKYKILVD
ncbi:hypothetical protein [Polaribacter sp. HL-MS24]|uniref:hypothetical protein n=1 Tax=Polaribacter sp. HL-MS24 TaxID=3077735 RepID=UPI002934B296|nr:hypothetical protein [Polaribacter sp. HL-MS24]WOC40541.1 hypothetical protein RRF69_01705 [Polaribacter sp. HL-MS24]